jgi:anaerobic magnesium-protoporphyrin IX monomethyl ester cyclase
MKILFVMVKEESIDPLNVQLLSALAKREGHETFLNVLEHNNLEDDLRRIRPNIVAYSAKTGESNMFLKVNRWLKSRYEDQILTIMGGPHVTFNHTRMRLYGEDLRPSAVSGIVRGKPLPIEETMLDVLSVGEADQSWPLLLRALTRKESIDSIPNMVTRSNRRADGRVNLLERTNFLDDLPYLDRELVYAKTHLKHFEMRSFMSSRGCPYPCTYCFNAKFNEIYSRKGKSIHRYSVDRLLAELSDIVSKHPTQFIKFWDDIFAFRTDEWLTEFAEKYPRVIGLPFNCLTRADLVRKDPSIIESLKKAGLHSINMSIESGNPFIRNQIFRRTMEDEDIRFAFDLCRRQSIRTFSNTILAVPAPLLPQANVPDFNERIEGLLGHLEDYFKINTAPLRGNYRLDGPLDLEARLRLLAKLQEMGLRHHHIDYDLESMDININNKVTFGEFYALAPYPGTALAQYTIDVGAFDGDYEKLYLTFQATSSFNCFSEKEKLQQLNISFLTIPLMVFPRLRNFAVKHLIDRPWTKLYFCLYFVFRAYLLGFQMYPMRYSLRSLLRKVYQTFRLQFVNHFDQHQRKFLKKRTKQADRLGGSWETYSVEKEIC